MRIVSREQVSSIVDTEYMLEKVADGFIRFSRGEALQPPVSHIHFAVERGDLQVKSAALKGGKYFAVKLATHFPDNVGWNLETVQGLILLCSQTTGVPQILFRDDGYLTHLRTALTGALCARTLAPHRIDRIGIVGSGHQARLQLHYLSHVLPCRQALVWARRTEAAEAICQDEGLREFHIERAETLEELARRSQLIVTATASEEPLLQAEWIQPGTHITALGADRPGKQELDPAILLKANRVIVDSYDQCTLYGELAHALPLGEGAIEHCTELGKVLDGSSVGRTAPSDITIADLTGLGVQDLQVATAALELLTVQNVEIPEA